MSQLPARYVLQSLMAGSAMRAGRSTAMRSALPPKLRLQSSSFASTSSTTIRAARPRFTPSSFSRARFASTSTSSASTSSGPAGEPTSAYARFKALTKKYGAWAVGMYLLLSAIDLPLTLAGVHWVGADRIEPVLDAAKKQYRTVRHGEQIAREMEEEDKEKRAAAQAEEAASGAKGRDVRWIGSATFWAELAVAYAIHKTAMLPVRAGLTVAWTPRVVEWLRARGWIARAKESVQSAAAAARGVKA